MNKRFLPHKKQLQQIKLLLIIHCSKDWKVLHRGLTGIYVIDFTIEKGLTTLVNRLDDSDQQRKG